MDKEIEITSEMSIGEDELFTEWFRCPNCNDTYIISRFNYCPNCGLKLRYNLEAVE